MNARVLRRAALALGLLAALLVVALVGRLPGIGAEAVSARDFTVTAQPTSTSVERGRSATFLVAVTPVGGFRGKVSFAVAGLTTGMTAAFSPSTLTLDPGAATSTLTVTTSRTTPAGATSLSVTGASGSTVRTLALTLVVTAPAPPGLSVAVAPATVTVAPGASVTYAVAVSRLNAFDGVVALSTSATLPAGIAMTLSPTSIPAGTSSPVPVTLTVTTSPTSPASTTALTVTATGAPVSPAVTASGTASLVVDTNQSSKAFSLSGNAAGILGPGALPSPIDLAISNPNNQPLRVGNLGVTVTGTSRPGCSPAEFTVRQYTGSYPLTVPARAEGVRLASLGVPTAALPAVAMLDGARNQDACKGVTVHLAYTGSATNR